jgi:flavin reductase (DIM6/NTAB) family NADH-FMN oxidoreductase RutF
MTFQIQESQQFLGTAGKKPQGIAIITLTDGIEGGCYFLFVVILILSHTPDPFFIIINTTAGSPTVVLFLNNSS